MKVGTDGVLLGAWVRTGKVKRILDIGTGTGLIALMLAQRSEAEIDAIEIEKRAAEQARDNINICPWANRITIHPISLQDYFPDVKYDLIVSNPPYFTNSQAYSGNTRALARHNLSLSMNELLLGITRLINKNGRFALIYPAESFDLLIENASATGFFACRITHVLPNPQSKIKRILAEFSRERSTAEYDKIIIEEGRRHQYSQKYKELTKGFYLEKC